MNEPVHQPGITRRTVLKGLGATLTLPWLESLSWAEGKKPAEQPPRRWACLLFANGVSEKDWWAKGAGKGMQLSRTLKSLEPHKEHLLFLNGLRLFDRTFGPHWPFFTNFLSGKELKNDPVPNVAESVDQRLARSLGNNTPLPSLHLGIEPVVPGLRLGVPGIYYSTISWSSKNTPIPPELYPRQAFDRLFDSSRLRQDKSVLDAVLEQSRDLRKKLSRLDQQKLDRYVTNVRELERRIDRTGKEERLEGWRPSVDKPTMTRPAEEFPHHVPEHMRLMLDILVVAFQMDKTRIATMVFNNDASRNPFDFLDGVSRTPMHSLSHYRNDKQKEEYRKINEFHVKQLAYLLERMKGIDEGGSSLLDNTMLLFGSNMMDGNRHDATHLPLVLCGGGGGTIRSGRVLSFTKEEDRRLCNLYLALSQRMGVADKRFGNSHYPLPGLS